MKMIAKSACLLFLVTMSFELFGKPFWLDLSAKNDSSKLVSAIASEGRIVSIEQARLEQYLLAADGAIEIDIPLPNGAMANYQLMPATSMAPQLAAKFPTLRSFVGSDISQPSNSGRFNLSPDGFSGMFLHDGKWIFLSPIKQSTNASHISYYREHALADEVTKRRNDLLNLPRNLQQPSLLAAKTLARSSGEQIRTYRLAVATSGEYTTELGGISAAMAELNTLVNRANGILLTDLSIQFELVANNDQLIFTNASTDPFTNNDAEADIEANQVLLDDTIGAANYDLGHLLNTNGGGLAFVGVACRENFKAQGYTGSDTPQGERFYIDLVLHELGHQLGASHSFNAIDSGSCDASQRSPETAVEPGSGTTIMSYSGICAPQNVQNSSDPYFHATSIDEIRSYIDDSIGGNCGTLSTPNNAIPQVTIDASRKTIPANTPFMLTASATDADSDALTYSWDQIDAGGDTGGTSDQFELAQDNGINPLFRSREPTTSATRYFPRLSDVLRDRVVAGEVYPTTERELNFEVVVRDNQGGIDSARIGMDVVILDTDFAVIAPASDIVWQGNSTQTVTWERADTHLVPIFCASVDISIDVDGDNQFESMVAKDTFNSGSAQITVPNTNSADARLMIKCSDNHFYAVNPGRFSIQADTSPIAPVITDQNPIVIAEDNSVTIDFSQLTVDDIDSDYPNGFSLSVAQGNNYTVSDRTITPINNFSGTLSVDVSVNDGALESNVFAVVIEVTAVNDPPIITSQDPIQIDEDGSIELLLNMLTVSDPDSNFPDDFSLIVSTGSNYTLTDSSVTPAPNFNGELAIDVAVSDGASQSVSFALVVSVSPLNDAPTAENDSVAVAENSASTIVEPLSNDSDIDGDNLTLSNLVYTGAGTLVQNGNQLTYTPATDFSGSESATYTISDGNGETDTATITFTVTPLVTPTPTPTPSSSGGGGSMNIGSLLLLLAYFLSCAGYIRQRRYDE